MTTSNGKLWLSVAEVIKTYGNARLFWVRRANEGEIKAKQTGKKYMFSKASVEAYLKGEVVVEDDTQKELKKIEDETALLIAKRKNKLAKLGYDSDAEFEKARAEFEPKRQALAELDARLKKAQEVQEQRQGGLDARKDILDKAWEGLKKWQEVYEGYLTVLRKAHKVICENCKRKLPVLKDFGLPDEIYTDTTPIKIDVQDQFDEADEVEDK